MALLTPRERLRRAALELVDALADALELPADTAGLAPPAEPGHGKTRGAPPEPEIIRARARAILEAKGRI